MAGKKCTKRPDKPASKSNSSGGDFVIPFKIPRPNESKLKAKFTDDKSEEDEDVVLVFREGDKDYNLIRGHLWFVGGRENKEISTSSRTRS